MACNHKFLIDLKLEKLRFDPVTLIVGTFNPAWPNANTAPWFYGRTARNYFWEVLPRLYGEASLRQAGPQQWKEFCTAHRIALTDLIQTIHDADPALPEHTDLLGSYLDTSIVQHFHQFDFTDIVGILQRFPTIQHVYLTRQAGIPLFDQLWLPVQDFRTAIGLDAPMLLTPSANARFQMGEWTQAHPGDPTPLASFIFEQWLNRWH